jgi:hypothetical protein
MGGRHKYVGVLPSAPKGSLMILLSPPQCHIGLGMMPHTLASVDPEKDTKGWIMVGKVTR